MPTAPEFLNDGRYRIDKVLGVGGMSVVLLAFDTRMQVPRAIKLLHKRFTRNPQVRERFENEATAQASLRHPNILMVHDVVDDPMGVYLVMELAEGGSLADQVKASGPLSPAEVAQIGITVGRALGAAHAEGVVHRDIKPENILRDRHGHLKVADFGIARVLVRSANLTQTGMVMGTWAYMPPEQRESARQVDGRADIYALGASLFFLLTGRQPSALHNPETHGREYDGVPEALARVVQKATRLYPEDRYQTCEELAADLERALPELHDKPLYPFEPPADPGSTLAPALGDLSTYMENNPDAAETLAPFLPGFEDSPIGGTAIPDDGPAASQAPSPAPIVNLAQASPAAGAPTLISAPEPDRRPSGVSGSQLIVFIAGVLAAVVAIAVLLPRLVNPQPTVAVSPTAPAEALTALEAQPSTPVEPPPVEPSPVEPPPAPTGTTKASTPAPDSTASTASSTAAPEATKGSTSAAPRIITVANEASSASSGTAASTPSAAQDPTGTVVVRTVPSGASVRLKGQELSRTGRGYLLPTGSHVLDVISPDGESTRIPVVVRRDQTIEVCYSFDTNSACADQ